MPPRKGNQKPYYQEKVNFADDSQNQAAGYPRQQNQYQNRQVRGQPMRGGPNMMRPPTMRPMIPHMDNIQELNDVELKGLVLQLV